MDRALAVLSLAMLSFTIISDVYAAPKTSSTGVACNSTGTARKDGKDQDGNKVNCQWDTCTYCGTTSGVIDCSKQLTEYSNPTDCHAAASIFGGNGHQSVFSNGNLGLQQVQPTTPKPKKFGNGAVKVSP
jgi:hypothetical protein